MNPAGWARKRTDMLPEIAAAVGFLSSLLRTRGCVSEQRLQVFGGALQEALTGEPAPRGSSRPASEARLPSRPGASLLRSWDGGPSESSSSTGFPSSTGGGPQAPITLSHASLPGPAIGSRSATVLVGRSGRGPMSWGAMSTPRLTAQKSRCLRV